MADLSLSAVADCGSLAVYMYEHGATGGANGSWWYFHSQGDTGGYSGGVLTHLSCLFGRLSCQSLQLAERFL